MKKTPPTDTTSTTASPRPVRPEITRPPRPGVTSTRRDIVTGAQQTEPTITPRPKVTKIRPDVLTREQQMSTVGHQTNSLATGSLETTSATRQTSVRPANTVRQDMQTVTVSQRQRDAVTRHNYEGSNAEKQTTGLSVTHAAAVKAVTWFTGFQTESPSQFSAVHSRQMTESLVAATARHTELPHSATTASNKLITSATSAFSVSHMTSSSPWKRQMTNDRREIVAKETAMMSRVVMDTTTPSGVVLDATTASAVPRSDVTESRSDVITGASLIPQFITGITCAAVGSQSTRNQVNAFPKVRVGVRVRADAWVRFDLGRVNFYISPPCVIERGAGNANNGASPKADDGRHRPRVGVTRVWSVALIYL